MTLSGPSFNKSTEYDGVTCVFYDEDGDVTEYNTRRRTAIKGIIVNCKAICPMPLFKKLGQHRLNVTVKNKSFLSGFEVGKPRVKDLYVADRLSVLSTTCKPFIVIKFDNFYIYFCILYSTKLFKKRLYV